MRPRTPHAALLALLITALAGSASADGLETFAAQLAGSGVLDFHFGGGDGVATFVVPADDAVADIVNNATNRRILGGTLTNASGRPAIFVRQLSHLGAPDLAFGVGSFATAHDPTTRHETLVGLALDAEQRILVLMNGSISGDGNAHGIVVRFETNGALDTTFGSDGFARLDSLLPQDAYEAIDVKFDPVSGGVVVCGNVTGEIFVARLTSAGLPDPAFGSGGLTRIRFGESLSFVKGLAVDPRRNGKVVAAGGLLSFDGIPSLAAVRLSANGAPDPTFDTDGVATPSFPFDSVANAVAVDSKGRVVLAGASAAIPRESASTVFRLRENGSVDTTFAGVGYSAQILPGTQASWYSAVALPPGGIIAAGSGLLPFGFVGQVSRYTPAGLLDPNFNSGATNVITVGTVSTEVTSLALDGAKALIGGNWVSSQ